MNPKSQLLKRYLRRLIGTDTVTPAYAGSIPGVAMDMLEVNAPVPNLNMMGPPPFSVGIAMGVSAVSPPVQFYVASPAN